MDFLSLKDAARLVTPPVFWIAARRLLRRGNDTRGSEPHLRPGLDGLDSLLEEHLDTSRAGFFVELGANDGVNQSNTYFLEREFGWRGLLVEPSLNRYLKLLQNRAADNSFACAACVPFDFNQEFVRLTYVNLMTVSRNLDSDLDDMQGHVAKGTEFLRSHSEVVDFGAIARTLDSLLVEADAPRRIELLSLDVEGAEIPVLNGVDHSKFRFQHMLIESRSPDALGRYLRDRRYRLIARLTRHDYLYVDEEWERA